MTNLKVVNIPVKTKSMIFMIFTFYKYKSNFFLLFFKNAMIIFISYIIYNYVVKIKNTLFE